MLPRYQEQEWKMPAPVLERGRGDLHPVLLPQCDGVGEGGHRALQYRLFPHLLADAFVGQVDLWCDLDRDMIIT